MSKSDLGAFLQACRAAVSPSAVGLPGNGPRRVAGLRREEVAGLIGLSTDYYVRLEQGRGGWPSQSVLDAIARVLLLDDVRREHLNRLAHPPLKSARTPDADVIPRSTTLFLETLTVPALVMTHRTGVIGWNDLACALFADFPALPARERNAARLLFGNEHVIARHRQWYAAARDTVGMLRKGMSEVPDDSELADMVAELCEQHSLFRELWAAHHVYEKTTGITALRHPEVGDIDLNFTTWKTAPAPRQLLVTYLPEPGSPSQQALSQLASALRDLAANR